MSTLLFSFSSWQLGTLQQLNACPTPVFSHPPNRKWLCQLLLLIALFALAIAAVWWYFDIRIKALQTYSPF